MGMFRRRRTGRRMALVLLVAAFLAAAGQRTADRNLLSAWWGTMYPKFCFQISITEKPEEIKVRFWLAKALDW